MPPGGTFPYPRARRAKQGGAGHSRACRVLRARVEWASLRDSQRLAGILVARFEMERDGLVVVKPNRQRRQSAANHERMRPDFEARALADFLAPAGGGVDGRRRRAERRVRAAY